MPTSVPSPQVVQSLRRILQAELDRDCTNRAVIGGLDSYLRRFAPLKTALPPLPPGGYEALTPDERHRWLQDAVVALDSHNKRAERRRTQRPARTASTPREPLKLDSSVTALGGVGRTLKERLGKLGIHTAGDLLYHFPHRYNDYSRVAAIANLSIGTEQTVIGTVWTAAATRIGRSRQGTEAIVGDSTGNLRVVWFNNTYVARDLKAGQRVALSGKVTVFRGQRVMESPEYEVLAEDEQTGAVHTSRLVPVYPLTGDLKARTLRRLIYNALQALVDSVPDPLPPSLRAQRRAPSINQALRQIHYPDSLDAAEAARRRLAFDELLVVQLTALSRRREWQTEAAPALSLTEETQRGFVASLPFSLTAAQNRVISEVLADLGRNQPMARLLQGDVGSGKTVVALTGLLAAVASGYQGAIMAPTEVLAEQHYRTISQLLAAGSVPDADGNLPEQLSLWHRDPSESAPIREPVRRFRLSYLDGRDVTVVLLIGGMSARDKEAVRQTISAGAADIVVGTHALIQERVTFPRLALAVVDEQHRFGVEQRAALRQKGEGRSPHLLVMTATPIPRTLALTLYGDLDISVLNEMPPGRQPVHTVRARPFERDEAYQFTREQLRQGRQAYVICPLVEESPVIEARAAVQEYQRLAQHVFSDFRLGLLHGRMSSSEKEKVMRAFRDGVLDILVSTAVVEVGIDVPNATVMLVEGADRFGLAQLHQFRGRVGRGGHQSYCILLAENPSDDAQERLRLLEQSHDGFALAEADLRMRGPGEYLGTRQSGLPDLRAARLSDLELMEEARQEAARILAEDPDLKRPEHALLAARVARILAGEGVQAEVS